MDPLAAAASFSFAGPSPRNLRRPSAPSARTISCRVAIRTPPPGFDYKSEVMEDTRSAVGREDPQLMDLVEKGRLVVVEKRRFGPVPSWRSAFVEPEAIWLVGTSHISAQSSEDVARVVRAVAPDNVVVELCRSRQGPSPHLHSLALPHKHTFRAGIMYTSPGDEASPLLKSNMFSLSGSEFLGAVGRSMDLGMFDLLIRPLCILCIILYSVCMSPMPGGQSALALRLLLAVYSSKISFASGQSFGDEFRAARRVSEEVGAQLVLGDRPIEITLERAWKSLKWNEKLKFVTSLFRGITSPSYSTSASSLKDEEMDVSPFQLYEQLSISYPSLLQPLIHERDTYLAWSLKRSKAVNNSKNVVGVIGKGHMNGVVYALVSDQGNLRFRDLVGRNSSTGGSNGWARKFLVGFVRDTFLGIILWALFEFLQQAL
ncbi:hypothetical protein Taro_012117 [Colocasia esculenta]|uniref:TraB domain-containing protein n=1 Tax=Colocasia esculenta TaxID=4460 RepID=A0A843UEP6_COLES|nr:hypothetical protein [Colocasia esculenta]